MLTNEDIDKGLQLRWKRIFNNQLALIPAWVLISMTTLTTLLSALNPITICINIGILFGWCMHSYVAACDDIIYSRMHLKSNNDKQRKLMLELIKQELDDHDTQAKGNNPKG